MVQLPEVPLMIKRTKPPFTSSPRCSGSGKFDGNAGEYILRCPVCGRTFDRKGLSMKLPPHTNPRETR